MHSKSQPKNAVSRIPCTKSILEPSDGHFDTPDRNPPSKVGKLHQRPPERPEGDAKCLPIRAIFPPPWRLEHLPDDPLKAEFEKRAVMDFQEPIGHVNSVIAVDPDQMSIEGRMMELC